MVKKNTEEDWTYIRIRISTAKKLRMLKASRGDDMYDATLNYLISKENLK